MSQHWIPASFYRGGSSKGVFFHARDLPANRADIEAILLSVLGSPDPYGRQLNGMGGGVSSLSKAVIIGPSTHPEADVDYTFAQVSVDRPVVDWGANCGNLSSVVGPFAVDEGLVAATDGEALVRIHQVNTRKLIHARFPVQAGRAVVEGPFAIDGVAGTGARIALDFLNPGGTVTRGLLPTGNVIDTALLPDGRRFDLSLIDATNPVVFLRAGDVGLTGIESPDEIDSRPDIMATLDALRRAGAVLMGLAPTAEAAGLANPKIAMVAPPAAFRTLDGRTIQAASHDVAIRMISMEKPHRAVALTNAMCLGVACRITGTIPNQLATKLAAPDEIRIGHPSGLVSVSAQVEQGPDWRATRATVFRTARRLMQGAVAA